MAKNRKSKPSSKTSTMAAVAPATPERAAAAKPTHDEIARRAYELWLARGATHGTHLENWLEAERELHTRAA
ncbi:MAG: DUF2934 domain-containing protein [Polyangiales bacterium]